MMVDQVVKEISAVIFINVFKNNSLLDYPEQAQLSAHP